MKTAIVAVTKQGVELAEKTAALLTEQGHEAVLFLPGKYSLLGISGKRQPYRKPLRELFGDLFIEYRGIVCIMALGIVVRLIAPLLKDKTTDPAVVVMDELGQNVVSVLSGHWGGANALTQQLAQGLQANPVITTATDVNGLPAIETVAQRHGLDIEPFELVKKVNSAIINGGHIVIYSDEPLDIEPVEHIEIREMADYLPSQKEKHRVVVVTNRTAAGFPLGTLLLRPKNLCIGVGCRKGVAKSEVLAAIRAAAEEAGRTMKSVACLASIDLKKEEDGLLEAAGELGLPVKFFSRAEILKVQEERERELNLSRLVDKKIGVGGVCEPVAILGAGDPAGLVMPKKIFGKVTVAIAEGNWQSSASDRAIPNK